MKLNRKKLKSLIMEEIRKLNEAPDPGFIQLVRDTLDRLPEPYTVEIMGDKIVCTIDGDPGEVAFEVVFKR